MLHARTPSDRSRCAPLEAEDEGAWVARHGAVLAELTELTLEAVRMLTDRMAAAKAAAEAAEADQQPEAAARADARLAQLGGAVARVSRSVRQSVMLEARLRRDPNSFGARPVRPPPAKVGDEEREFEGLEGMTAERAAAIRPGVRMKLLAGTASHLIGDAIERIEDEVERERLSALLDERLSDFVTQTQYSDEQVETCIALVCRDIGFDAALVRGYGEDWDTEPDANDMFSRWRRRFAELRPLPDVSGFEPWWEADSS